MPAVSVDRLAPAGFVDLSDVDPTILTDIRYYTAHNFVGRPIAGYSWLITFDQAFDVPTIDPAPVLPTGASETRSGSSGP